MCVVSCAACYVCSFGICEFLKSNGIDGTSHKTNNEIHTDCLYIHIYMYKYVYMSFRQNEQECENKAALAFTKVCISLVCIVIVCVVVVHYHYHCFGVYKTQIAPPRVANSAPAWSSRDLTKPDTLIHKHTMCILYVLHTHT